MPYPGAQRRLYKLPAFGYGREIYFYLLWITFKIQLNSWLQFANISLRLCITFYLLSKLSVYAQVVYKFVYN